MDGVGNSVPGMRNIIALLFLIATMPAQAQVRDWRDTMDDIEREARADRRNSEQLSAQRQRDIWNQIGQADHDRKMEYQLDTIERQNRSIQNGIDDIRSRRRY